MFRNKFQKGYLSILYSCGGAPLELWSTHVQNGFIRRVTDQEINSLALEIAGTNVSTTYIYTPKDPKTSLGIELPFCIMIVKNMRRYFTFEITVLDDKRMHRRFRLSNFQKLVTIRPFSTTLPLCLRGGWAQLQFNLPDCVKRAYKSNYVETTRIQINANCRIRRIYFADRLYSMDELPEEFKLVLPLPKCVRAGDKRSKDRTSKNLKDQLSNGSQPPLLTSQRTSVEVLPLSSTSAIKTAEEQPKLDIHVPSADYGEETDREIEHDSEFEESFTKDEEKIDELNEVTSIEDKQSVDDEGFDIGDEQKSVDNEEESLSIEQREENYFNNSDEQNNIKKYVESY
ncbi:cilia- and flagella-associated protein 20-like [Chelonus insularis]|uniref:cilia- and flagella-associated protein 20-like n=1 Tax=Chelonus insularis TaxID=460826 RepID=UPI00158D8826|nr:cilia- and flagella-associated protein 20-like [Chelonus insularis]